MLRIMITMIFVCLVVFSHRGLAQGLKDTSPEELVKPEKAPEEPKAKKKKKSKKKRKKKTSDDEPMVPADEAVNQKEKSKSGLDDRLLLGLEMGFFSLKPDSDSWTTGVSGGLYAAYKILPITQSLDFFASYSYSPVDALVDTDAGEYRGIIESHTFGSLVQYHHGDTLSFDGRAEIGYSKATLTAETTIAEGSKDPEVDGVALRIGASAFWKFQDKVRLGGGVNLSIGTFTGLSAVVSTQFIM